MTLRLEQAVAFRDLFTVFSAHHKAFRLPGVFLHHNILLPYGAN